MRRTAARRSRRTPARPTAPGADYLTVEQVAVKLGTLPRAIRRRIGRGCFRVPVRDRLVPGLW